MSASCVPMACAATGTSPPCCGENPHCAEKGVFDAGGGGGGGGGVPPELELPQPASERATKSRATTSNEIAKASRDVWRRRGAIGTKLPEVEHHCRVTESYTDLGTVVRFTGLKGRVGTRFATTTAWYTFRGLNSCNQTICLHSAGLSCGNSSGEDRI